MSGDKTKKKILIVSKGVAAQKNQVRDCRDEPSKVGFREEMIRKMRWRNIF
jgi:hypothetical protein